MQGKHRARVAIVSAEKNSRVVGVTSAAPDGNRATKVTPTAPIRGRYSSAEPYFRWDSAKACSNSWTLRSN